MVKRDLDGVLPLRVGSCFCRAFWPQYQLYTVVVSRATLVQRENATAAVTNLSYKSSNQPEHRTSPLAPAVLTWVVFFGGSTLLELALSVRTPKDSQHVLAFWHVQDLAHPESRQLLFCSNQVAAFERVGVRN